MKRAVPSLRYQLLAAFLTSVLLFLLLTSLAGFWKMEIPLWHVAAYAIAGAAFGWFWSRSRRSALLTTIAAVLLLRTAALLRPQWNALFRFLWQDLRHLWDGLIRFQWETSFSMQLGNLFLILIALGGGALILRENLHRGSAFRALAAGALIFGTEWSWFYDASTVLFIPYLLLCWVLWILGQAAVRHAQWTTAGRHIHMHRRSAAAAPLIGLLCVALVAAILPTKATPVNLGQFGVEAQRLFPFLTQLRGTVVSTDGRFNLSATGFAPDLGTLGGPVELDPSLALYVTLPDPPTETIYLRGATFQVYNGHTWFAGDTGTAPLSAQGALPSQLGSTVMREERTLEIRPMEAFGRTLFTVLEPAKLEGYGFDADVDGILLADQEVVPGTTYRVTARMPIYSGDQIRSLSQKEPDARYRPYLQLPASLPERVRTLAHSITRGAQHPYDQALLLEAWLRDLPYDLNVPAPPSDQDFVDHFLFNTRRGYCTYFSSAMVVMLRELGIPSRLVEGFAVPPYSMGSRDSQGRWVIPVYNAMAHAWVEAYFPGYGWVTFDPTPRADLPLVDRTAPAPLLDTDTPGESATAFKNDDDTSPSQVQTPTVVAEGDTTLPAEGSAPKHRLPVLPVLLGVCLGLTMLLGLARRRRQPTAEPPTDGVPQRVQQSWAQLDSLMAHFGAGRRPDQTPREYARTIGDTWPALRQQADQVARDYEQIQYAPPEEPVDPEAARRAAGFLQAVRTNLIHQYGRVRFLWRRMGLPGLRRLKGA